ncbi:MAG: hypothetical protein E6268_04455 [Veillonella sp.]|jgi:hypothetical protein|uniref:hypothetical protein n=1 Tax=Veillonella sp. TaxID=1926307 RepID=UPI0028E8AF3D|nr:hypothetical protein [Veillonella sp.]MDU5003691.1 hypothetical protein [Veillonella sp.]
MTKYVLSVDKNRPIEIEILNNTSSESKVVHGCLKNYSIDYDVKSSSVILRFTLHEDLTTSYSVRLTEDDSVVTDMDLTPQEVFFRIVNFLGEVIYKAKSIGNTLVMKLDNQTSKLFVKDLTKIEDEYRVFKGELVY